MKMRQLNITLNCADGMTAANRTQRSGAWRADGMQLHNLYYVMFCCLNSKTTGNHAELRSANAKTVSPSCGGIPCFVSMKAPKMRSIWKKMKMKVAV